LEALGDTGDHVVHERADGADTGNVLTATMVDDKLELVLTSKLDFNVQVTEVLVQSATRTSNSNVAGLDADLDTLRDDEFVVLVDILHGLIGANDDQQECRWMDE
jgi:hypothetical protein